MCALESADVIVCNTTSIPASKPGTVRSASFLYIVLTFEIAISIGFRSGEYGGNRITTLPADSTSSSTRLAVAKKRTTIPTLSPITIPDSKL